MFAPEESRGALLDRAVLAAAVEEAGNEERQMANQLRISLGGVFPQTHRRVRKPLVCPHSIWQVCVGPDPKHTEVSEKTSIYFNRLWIGAEEEEIDWNLEGGAVFDVLSRD